MTIACGCRESCPDAPDITVNDNSLQLDGAVVTFKDDYFSGPASTSALTGLPYQPSGVLVSRGGVVQQQNVDFTIDGQTLTWIPAMIAGERGHAHYMSIGEVSASVAFPTGFQMPWASSTAPTGFLLMDGTTSYSRTTYANLFAFANPLGLVLSSTSTEFVLKNTKSELTDVASSATVLYNTVIKY